MSWPRRTGLRRTEVVSGLALQSALEQMVQAAITLGAGRPYIAAQMLTKSLPRTNMNKKHVDEFIAELDHHRRIITSRKPPWAVLAGGLVPDISANLRWEDLGWNTIQNPWTSAMNRGLVWGLLHHEAACQAFEDETKTYRAGSADAIRSGLAIPAASPFPTLDSRFEHVEGIVRSFERRFGRLPDPAQDIMSAPAFKGRLQASSLSTLGETGTIRQGGFYSRHFEMAASIEPQLRSGALRLGATMEQVNARFIEMLNVIYRLDAELWSPLGERAVDAIYELVYSPAGAGAVHWKISKSAIRSGFAIRIAEVVIGKETGRIIDELTIPPTGRDIILSLKWAISKWNENGFPALQLTKSGTAEDWMRKLLSSTLDIMEHPDDYTLTSAAEDAHMHLNKIVSQWIEFGFPTPQPEKAVRNRILRLVVLGMFLDMADYPVMPELTETVLWAIDDTALGMVAQWERQLGPLTKKETVFQNLRADCLWGYTVCALEKSEALGEFLGSDPFGNTR